MPSTKTISLFAMAAIAATVMLWAIFDHSVAKTAVLDLGMLFGGSMYFLLKARE